MNRTYTRKFPEIGRQDVPSVGGKGAFLGQMTRDGLPVPPGFVVCTNAFMDFLQARHLIEEAAAGFGDLRRGKSTPERFSRRMTEAIREGAFPTGMAAEIEEQFAALPAPLAAVRSSATVEDGAAHSWAGQLESYLNVTFDLLLPSVKKCWASLFSPRALAYEMSAPPGPAFPAVAVVVQVMINPEVAGVAFPVNPVTEDHNQIVIEAGYGLGEAVVSGRITPDHYEVDKHTFAVTGRYLSPQGRGILHVVERDRKRPCPAAETAG